MKTVYPQTLWQNQQPGTQSVINQSSVKVYFMKTPSLKVKLSLIGTTLKTVLCGLDASKQQNTKLPFKI